MINRIPIPGGGFADPGAKNPTPTDNNEKPTYLPTEDEIKEDKKEYLDDLSEALDF